MLLLQVMILRWLVALLCSAGAHGNGHGEEHGLIRQEGMEELAHIDLARTPPEVVRDEQGVPSSRGSVATLDSASGVAWAPGLHDSDRDSILKAR